MANKKKLIKASKRFIEKVDCGGAGSIKTYAEIKEALESEEEKVVYKAEISDGNDSWEESYVEDDLVDLEFEEYMNQIITTFNKNLRPNERPRKILTLSKTEISSIVTYLKMRD